MFNWLKKIFTCKPKQTTTAQKHNNEPKGKSKGIDAGMNNNSPNSSQLKPIAIKTSKEQPQDTLSTPDIEKKQNAHTTNTQTPSKNTAPTPKAENEDLSLQPKQQQQQQEKQKQSVDLDLPLPLVTKDTTTTTSSKNTEQTTPPLANAQLNNTNIINDTTETDMPNTNPHESAHTAPKNIYALLVGINNYQTVKRLNGCTNDVKHVRSFLQQKVASDTTSVHIESLVNSEATKQAIVTQFNRHLGQAQAGDAVFFYFAGHGAQEKTTAFKRFEPDGRIEIILCYDGDAAKNNDLADKELRYLINQLAKEEVQVLTIFDCCHSGDVTRSITEHPPSSNQSTTTRQASQRAGVLVKAERKWSDFIFGNQLDVDDIRQRLQLNESLPEGRHIALFACKSQELASEDLSVIRETRGAFTKRLFTIWSKFGLQMPYYELINRTKNALLNDNFFQNPQFYSPNTSDIFGSLQNGIDAQARLYTTAVYNSIKRHWRANLGAFAGINQDSNNIFFYTNNEANKQKVLVKEVMPNYTLFNLPNNFRNQADTTQPISVVVEGVRSIIIKVAVVGARAQELYDYWKLEPVQKQIMYSIQAVAINDFYHYKVLASNDCFSICQKIENEILVEQYAATSNNVFAEITKDLKHIAQWEFVKQIHNPSPQLFRQHLPLVVTAERASNPNAKFVHEVSLNPMPLTSGQLLIDLKKADFGNKNMTAQEYIDNPVPFAFTIKIKNTYRRKLHIACMYLSHLYGAMQTFPTKTIVLNPTQEKAIANGALLKLSIPNYVIWQNRASYNEYFKIIVSTDDFANALPLLTLPNLNPPKQQCTKSDTERLEVGASRRNPIQHDWTMKLLIVNINNPFFDADKKRQQL